MKITHRLYAACLLLAAVVILTACSFGGTAATPNAPTPTRSVAAASATPAPPAATSTNTVVPPSPTQTASLTPQRAATATPSATAVPPSPTPAPSPTPSKSVPSPSPTPPSPTPRATATATPSQMTVQIYLIAIGDDGKSGPKIGCGDSAVPVRVQVPYTLGVLRASLDKLLSIKQRDYGASGLYNVLYQSDLQVESVTIEAGTATIRLTGALTLGGECDSPRVDAEIRYTALQFSTVRDVDIFLNDRPLADVLSLK